MFLPLVVALVALLACVALASGPRAAFALACGLTLVVPTWISRPLGATVVDLRAVLCGAVFVILLLHREARIAARIVLTDLLAVAVVVALCYAEYLANNLAVTTAAGFAITWLLPYALGRCVLLGQFDSKRIAHVAAGAAIVVGLWSIVEATTGANLAILLTGNAGSIQGATEYRWGLKRVEGPMTHPIFFGMLLVLAMPWLIEAARLARRGEGPSWWKLAPFFAGIGIFCSMSRGPQLALVATIVGTLALRAPKWRGGLLGMCVVAAIALFFARDAIVDGLQAWSGEAKTATLTISINGESVEYTGTNHRLLLLRVYADAIAHAGWFGFGAAKMIGGVTQVPHVEAQLRELFSSIDNHYIQFVLQAGYAGVICFVLLGVVGLSYLVRPAIDLRNDGGTLAAALFSANAAVMLMLFTVWFSADFGFLWLFNLGVAAAWRSESLGSALVAAVPRIRRRLVTGAAQWT